MIKKWRKRTCDEKLAREVAKEFGISYLLSKILVSRGITSPGKVEDFLYPSLEKAENPFVFPDMKKASERLAKAIINREVIGIFSDADADGITSAAVISSFLRDCGFPEENILVRVPSRDKEGYGLTKDFIDQARAKNSKLIITADCGVRNHEEIRYAKLFGIDVIVCDHHHLDYSLPQHALAVLHPKTIPHDSSTKFLSGAGVSFELIASTRAKIGKDLPKPRKYLDIVSVGTIGDMVPLLGDNRIFVKFGIDLIRGGTGNIGLATLAQKVTKREKISSRDIQMRIVPRINSSGRAGKPEISFRLLFDQNIKDIEKLSDEIESMNSWRRETVDSILDDIKFLGLIDDSKWSVVVWGEDWHEGVLGLVAAKILEATGKPTCVISIRNDIARGSIRAPEFINIMGVLDKVSHTLTKYGGHSQAAGISLQPEKVQEFADCFEKAVRESLGPKGAPEIIVDYDEYLHLGEVRSSDLVELTKLEPFGEGNPFPVFLIDAEIVESRTVGKEDEHIKMIAKTKDGYAEIIAYGLAEKIEPIIGKIKAMVRFKSSAWSDLGFEFELIQILEDK
jgi:single-stranded-DNA-specific exonuclease